MALLGLKLAIRRPPEAQEIQTEPSLASRRPLSGPKTVEKRALRGLRKWRISGAKSIWIEGGPIHGPPVDLLLKMEGGDRETEQRASQRDRARPDRQRARQTEPDRQTPQTDRRTAGVCRAYGL